ARARARGPCARGRRRWARARRAPLGRDGPGLRAHHEDVDAGVRAHLRHPRGARRLLDWPLRRVDLLLHRRQHRRSPKPRCAARRRTRKIVPMATSFLDALREMSKPGAAEGSKAILAHETEIVPGARPIPELDDGWKAPHP